MSGLLVREAVPADLDAIVALQREDVIREVHEDDVPVSAYRAAFDEITDDPRQQLLVGELDGHVLDLGRGAARSGSSSPRTRSAPRRDGSMIGSGSPRRTSA